MKKKILVVVFNLERAAEHEWYIEFMDPLKFEIHFVLIKKAHSYLHRFLESKGIKVVCLNYDHKLDFPLLISRLILLMRRERYDIVHTHLFESSLAGLIAARIAGVRHRIVTRHHSDYHHVYHPSAVKYDKIINALATKIIAVSRTVQNVLLIKEDADPVKVITIPHTIKTTNFHPESVGEERRAMIRRKYNISHSKNIIGVVSRFIAWKGLGYIVPAFYKIKEKFPDAILILANAQGPDLEAVMKLLTPLAPENYRLISFEEDMPALYGVFNCFIHAPVSKSAEAFGQTYIEALASGVPSIFTLSGIANDFALDEINCLVVPHCNTPAITVAVMRLFDDRNNTLKSKMINNGLALVDKEFSVEIKYQRLTELYDSMN